MYRNMYCCVSQHVLLCVATYTAMCRNIYRYVSHHLPLLCSIYCPKELPSNTSLRWTWPCEDAASGMRGPSGSRNEYGLQSPSATQHVSGRDEGVTNPAANGNIVVRPTGSEPPWRARGAHLQLRHRGASPQGPRLLPSAR